MNVGMLACYDQAKEIVATVLNDPMTDGPSLPTKLGSSCIAVSYSFHIYWNNHYEIQISNNFCIFFALC